MYSGKQLQVTNLPSMIALDGEREFSVHADQEVSVRLNLQGPQVLDIEKTLELATQRAFACPAKQLDPAISQTRRR